MDKFGLLFIEYGNPEKKMWGRVRHHFLKQRFDKKKLGQ